MKRILLKLSGEALAGEKKTGFDEETVRKVALQVKELVDDGIQVGIVIGGGNFWRGRSSENIDRTKADQIGMLATVMNCIYVSEIFRSVGMMTNILTPFECGSFTKLFSKDRANKYFAKGMVALAAMVAVTAILGTIALGMMFDSNHIPQDLMTNGAYYAFQKLGEYYHVGNFFVVVYALTNLIGQFSVMVLSVDAPLRMLLDSADSRFIPGKMFEKNEHGTYVNGHRLVTLIVCVLIVVPAFGIRNVDALVRWLVKVNSVCMPLRYLWVFVAYIALKRAGDAFCGEYRFVKGKTAGILVGGWCFLFTAFACLTGIYSEDPFQLALNIVTPFVLVGLGFIMPWMAAKEKKS